MFPYTAIVAYKKIAQRYKKKRTYANKSIIFLLKYTFLCVLACSQP